MIEHKLCSKIYWISWSTWTWPCNIY